MIKQKIQSPTRDFGQALLNADARLSESPEHSTEKQSRYDRLRSEITTRIEKQGTPLKNWDVTIHNGVRTGFNNAFVIDGNTKNRLARDPKNTELLKPVLTGKDIRKWETDFKDQWLVGTFPSLNLDINQYHGIKEYLSAYRKRLEPKPKGFEGKWKGRTSGSYKWFETQNCITYHKNFEKPKIIWPHLALNPEFALDTEHFYLTAPSNMLTMKNSRHPQEIKYLLAVLNSRISGYYMRQIGYSREGGYLEYKKSFVEKIPIRKIPSSEQEPFIRLADYILFLKQQPLTTSTEKLMPIFFGHIIDGLCYELYLPESVGKSKRAFAKYLQNLPDISAQSDKMRCVSEIFTEFYRQDHPIRNSVFFIDSVPEIAMIEKIVT